MKTLTQMGSDAKKASTYLAKLGIKERNNALLKVADALVKRSDYIRESNAIDLANGKKNNMSTALLDRLMLTESRIEGMADGLRVLAGLDDPIGEVKSMKTRPNGLMIGKKTVPLGVVAIIYESRPNVTADAFGLCFKSANACILRGGSDSVNSNIAIVNVITDVLKGLGIDPDVISYISETDRKYVDELMHLNEYVDVIIPRGGAGLIKNVVNNSTVPVIETGTGNCHIYEKALAIDDRIIKADDTDWGREYLDYIISVKVVDNIDEAIAHINRYNTGHSESIITKDYNNAQKFLNEIDAACVYVNASTRFTDGFEFGFGAEIGISTQKIHARGPMGLEALTTSKYIIYGNGQVRE